MATSSEMEIIKKAIRLLYSPHPNSATELRTMLDEAIKQRHGPEKMLINTIGKSLLEEEMNFPGRAATPTPQKQQQEADEVINLTNSPTKTISDSPDTIADSDDGGGGGAVAVADTSMMSTGDDDVNLKEFGDLNCCVCGEMVFTATNRLIECSKCGALYHQECHKPAITDEEASEGQAHNWQCDTCLNKPSTSKAAGLTIDVDEPIPLVSKTKSSATSSRSSSTSNSSSPFAVNVQQETAAASSPATTTTSSTSKHHHKSSKSHKEERPSSSSSKSGSSSSTLTPATTSTTEKSSSSHSSKKSSHSTSSKSSSSKSSRHHESSSSRKKTKS